MTVLHMHPRKRLGELLAEAGLLDRKQLFEALQCRLSGERIGRALVRLNFVDEETVTVALSQQTNLPAIHLDSAPIAPNVARLLPLELVERYGVFPLSVHRKQKLLRVATADPLNEEIPRALALHTGLRILLFVTGERALERAVRRHYHGETLPRSQATADSPGVPQSALAFSWPAQLSDARKSELHAQVDAHDGRLAKLERLVLTQGFALRGMLELLDQGGVLRRDDFLDRMTDGSRPPPLPLRKTAKPVPPPKHVPSRG